MIVSLYLRSAYMQMALIVVTQRVDMLWKNLVYLKHVISTLQVIIVLPSFHNWFVSLSCILLAVRPTVVFHSSVGLYLHVFSLQIRLVKVVLQLVKPLLWLPRVKLFRLLLKFNLVCQAFCIRHRFRDIILHGVKYLIVRQSVFLK